MAESSTPARARIEIADLSYRYFKGFSCSFPRGRVSVVTGPSGTGKSTLLFEILGAESRRRIESLFGERLSQQSFKGTIRGLPLAVECAALRRRSRFGTVASEIGLVRGLSEIVPGHSIQHCIACDRPLNIWSIERLLSFTQRELSTTSALTVELHLVINPTEVAPRLSWFESVIAAGFNRVIWSGERREIQDLLPVLDEIDGDLQIFIDRFKLIPGNLSRLRDGYTTVVDLIRSSGGKNAQMMVTFPDSGNISGPVLIAAEFRCDSCNAVQREVRSALFNYSVEACGCTNCLGLGSISRGAQCPKCNGLRFCEEVLALRIDGLTFRDLVSLSVEELSSRLSETQVGELVVRLLRPMLKVGLGYLGVMRGVSTLSSGELQRLKLVNATNSVGTGMLYLLDEPCSSLHPADVPGVREYLSELCGGTNTIIASEPSLVFGAACDEVLELGPGSGPNGSKLVRHGSPEAQRYSETVERKVSAISENRGEMFTVSGVTKHTLRDIRVDIPINRLSTVVGVSGSGKSTFVFDLLATTLRDDIRRRRLVVDELEPGVNNISGADRIRRLLTLKDILHRGRLRSSVSASLGVLAGLQELYARAPAAKAFGYTRKELSLRSSRTRCQRCLGFGIVGDERAICSTCEGGLFSSEICRVRVFNRDLSEVMRLTVKEALDIFSRIPNVAEPLQQAIELGLGYLRLGQSSATLSVGEEQRVRLASLVNKRTTDNVILLDEPSRGMSGGEVVKLLEFLHRLVAQHNTVIAIEHNLTMIGGSDHIIEFGPGAGSSGGVVIAEGNLSQIRHQNASRIATYL